MLTEDQLLRAMCPPECEYEEPPDDGDRAEVVAMARRVEAAVRAEVAQQIRTMRAGDLVHEVRDYLKSDAVDLTDVAATAEVLAQRIEKAGAK